MDDLHELAREACGACLAPVLCLIAKEDDLVQEGHEGGLPEGARLRVEVNRYERSSANRAACIAIFGAKCWACGFEFERMYGAHGAGFIEVHHLVMVSRMGRGYVVDPATDLVPLCSNCHSMIHHTDPPLPVDQLKALLDDRRR